MNPTTINLQKAIEVQQALRREARLGPEAFSVEQFVGMIRDELAALRQAGRSDQDIAAILSAHGIQLTPEELKHGRP